MPVVLACVALVLLLVRLWALVGVHLVPSPYSPWRNPVSDYAVGPTRKLATIGTLSGAGAWACLAGAVWWGQPGWSYRGIATAMLVALAALFGLLVKAPTDVVGTARTRTGRIHLVLAVVWFGLAYALTGDVVRWAGPGAFGSALDVLHWVALAGLVALVGTLIVRPVRAAFPLSEQVFLLAIALFYPVFALALALRLWA